MRRIFSLLVSVVFITVWCKPSFAAQQGIPPSAALNAAGVAEGVTITGAATLTVDGTGGFANIGNTLGVSITNNAINQGIIAFSTTSVVSGSIGDNTNTLADVQLLAGATTVTFNGAVYSVLMKVAASTKAVFNDGSILNKAAVDFTGDGTINVAANTKVTGALTTATADTGTLNLYGAASGTDQWTGAIGGATGLRSINVVGGTNTAGIFSKITGAVDVYDLELATNTLNITGALTLHGSSIINTTIASATVYGKVVPTGVATEVGGFSVNVTVPTGTFIPVGTLFNIVDATSGTGAIPVVVTLAAGTNPLYTFTANPTTNGQVQLQITGNPVAVPVVTPPADPVVPVAAVIADALAAAPATTDISSVRAAISDLTTASAVVNAEAQLAPLAPALAAPLVTFQGIRRFQDLWLARLDACNSFNKLWPDKADPNCRGEDTQSSNWWVKGVGYYGLRKDSGAYKGFETRTLGAMVAYDAPVDTDTRAGLGIGYAQTVINGKTFDTDMNFGTHRAMAYIGHEPGPWFINGGLSYGWTEYSGRRHISFPGVDRTANAKYEGQDYTAFTSAGHHFLAKKFTITPFASLQYTRVEMGEYAETGAGDINLKVNSQGYNFYESGLGVKVARDFKYRGNMFVPDLHFKWLHDFSSPTLKQTARFNYTGTSTFVTHGLKIADDTYNVGLGFTLLSCACHATIWSVEAGYDYEWRKDNYSANQATLRVTKRF